MRNIFEYGTYQDYTRIKSTNFVRGNEELEEVSTDGIQNAVYLRVIRIYEFGNLKGLYYANYNHYLERELIDPNIRYVLLVLVVWKMVKLDL